MNEQKGKARVMKKTDKKQSLLFSILVIVAVFTINLFTGDIFNGLANSYLADFLVKLKCAVLAVLGAVILRKTWIYRHSDPVLLKKGWSAGAFELLFMCFMLFSFLASKQSITAQPTDILFFVLEMICVGIYEETLFRGLLQNAFNEFFGEDTVKHVTLAVVLAGVSFGALHLTNVLKPGVSLSDAAMQALNACGAGIFYGAVYFRTGKNLWYNVLIHALHDIVVFIFQGALSGANSSAVISQASQHNSMAMLIGQTVLYGAIGLFLLRKKRVEPLLKKR